MIQVCTKEMTEMLLDFKELRLKSDQDCNLQLIAIFEKLCSSLGSEIVQFEMAEIERARCAIKSVMQDLDAGWRYDYKQLLFRADWILQNIGKNDFQIYQYPVKTNIRTG